MSPDPTERLNRILTTFDTESLGEGDTAAGANVLAAMAYSLANVHRRGAGLASGDGPMLHAGSSLLVSGPLSSSLIAERVVGVLAAMQANLLTHLDEWDIARQFVIDNTIPVGGCRGGPCARLNTGDRTGVGGKERSKRAIDEVPVEPLIDPLTSARWIVADMPSSVMGIRHFPEF